MNLGVLKNQITDRNLSVDVRRTVALLTMAHFFSPQAALQPFDSLPWGELETLYPELKNRPRSFGVDVRSSMQVYAQQRGILDLIDEMIDDVIFDEKDDDKVVLMALFDALIGGGAMSPDKDTRYAVYHSVRSPLRTMAIELLAADDPDLAERGEELFKALFAALEAKNDGQAKANLLSDILTVFRAKVGNHHTIPNDGGDIPF